MYGARFLKQREETCPKREIGTRAQRRPAAPQRSPVILSDGSQQLPAAARVKAADAARGLLDLGHLVLVLEVDGFSELNLQEADNLVV